MEIVLTAAILPNEAPFSCMPSLRRRCPMTRTRVEKIVPPQKLRGDELLGCAHTHITRPASQARRACTTIDFTVVLPAEPVTLVAQAGSDIRGYLAHQRIGIRGEEHVAALNHARQDC